jgi:GntR family transcriptional regulator
MTPISRKQPLYDQLVDLLHEKIENEMGAGDMLPSERELCETYGLSRTTVRLALAELERQGLVTRQHGRGTFVSDSVREATNLMGTYSFTEQMRSMGRVPSTVVLEFDTREAPKHIAACLGLRIGDHVIRMKRLRIADGIPMMVERTYLPASEFLGLTQGRRGAAPLRPYGEGLPRDHPRGERRSSARALPARTTRSFSAFRGAPVLKLYRTTFNVKNTAIEYTRSVARADQFRYKVSHYRG